MKKILALALIACVPQPVCRTTCGMVLEGPVPERTRTYRGAPWWTCDQFQRAEDVIVSNFQKDVTDPRFASACSALKGWRVAVQPVLSWDDGREAVGGLAYCDAAYMMIDDASPLHSSLPHEMAHAIQRCSARGPYPDGGQDARDHANWQRDGILAALVDDQNVAVADESRCAYYSDGGVASADGLFADAYSGPQPGYGPGDDGGLCPGIPAF